MSVFFISDLHIAHPLIARKRGFSSSEDHDLSIIENINRTVSKRDKLYILGDVCFSLEKMKMFHMLRVQTIEMLYGNHDKFNTQVYLQYFSKVHGFYKYKDLWLSHCPIHPQELYRVKGNVHGHIHRGLATKPLGDPRYYNVNADFNGGIPVSFETIQEYFQQLPTIDYSDWV